MNKFPYFKIFIITLLLLTAIAIFFAYKQFQRGVSDSPTAPVEQIAKPTTDNQISSPISTDNVVDINPDINSQTASEDNSAQSTPTDNINDIKAPISSSVDIQGDTLAHITPQHCNDNCRAFAIDLKLFEYCEQSCGISPIKNVSNCDGKKNLEKDYCNKDLAINKKDSALCEKITDGNIKQACKNRISQDIIESL